MGKALLVAAIIALVILFVVAGERLALDRFWEGLIGEKEVKIAEAEAEAALANLETEREKTRQLQEKVDLTRAQNEGMIYRANAQSITRQSRAHVALQGVMVVFACAGLIAGGLLVTVLLKERYA